MKKSSPYSQYENHQLILRDELAIDRTLLANERTFLSYLRSGVALAIAGLSIMHFSGTAWFWWVGVACLPSGIVTALVGFLRYRRMGADIALARQLSASTKADV